MKSRLHPKYKTKYRVRNWASYERALIGRGNITIWLSPAAIAAWKPEGTRTRGAPPKYSDLAIETALTLRLLFHLPLRQAEGFLTSLFHLMGLDLRSPDHTTLSRRGQHLNLTPRATPKTGAVSCERRNISAIIRATGSGGGQMQHRRADHGRRLSHEDHLEIQQRVSEGETFASAAAAVRCSTKSIQRFMARTGGRSRAVEAVDDDILATDSSMGRTDGVGTSAIRHFRSSPCR